MTEGSTGADGPRRASGVLACGLVTAIAVLAAAGVVGWARLGSHPATRGAPVPEPIEEAVPETLAGGLELGAVPDAVAAAVDGPVVAARFLDEMPDGVGCEFLRADFEGEPDLETLMLTPDKVHVSLVGASGLFAEGEGGAGRARATCTARWQEGGWHESGGGMGPADQPMAGPTGSSCCDQDGLGTAEATVLAPEGAQWVLQDRGRYHLAYPVPATRAVPVSWRFPAQGGFGGGFDRGFGGGEMVSATTVLFVDEAGEVLGETVLRS